MHRLPPNPRDAVVEWRVTGGAGAGAATEADLVVRADGSATAGTRFGGGRAVDGTVAPERLQGLLDEIIDERGFFGIDGPELERRMRAERDRRTVAGAAAAEGEAIAVPVGPPYLDAAGTSIAVAADERRHEVAVQGLAPAAREYPEIRGLADLRAIELALLKLAERIGRGPPA